MMRYRRPAFTFGRRHKRKETVIAPDRTPSRKSGLNSTRSCYVALSAHLADRDSGTGRLTTGPASVRARYASAAISAVRQMLASTASVRRTPAADVTTPFNSEPAG